MRFEGASINNIQLLRIKARGESSYKDFKLGQWMSSKRQNYSQGKLDKNRIDLLESVDGWFWDILEMTWLNNFNLTKEFLESNSFKELKALTEYKGFKIGDWLTKQRRELKNNSLNITPERKQMLYSLPGFFSDHKRDTDWEIKYNEVYKIASEISEPYLRATNSSFNKEQVSWIKNQRTSGGGDPERKLKLEKIKGWNWNEDEERFMHNFSLLKKYQAENKNCLIPSRLIIEGVKFGSWIVFTKKSFRDGKLEKDKIELFESIPGWFWDTLDDYNWTIKYEIIFKLLSENKVINDSKDTVSEAQWIRKQKKDFQLSRLKPWKIKKLESLRGWVW